ncbi:MAG: hypothetical protein LBQ48_03460, partial [Oscillospiraceae bacterium]|nr:hypothetical protein [Oscillospiraceae bacterium]
MSARRIAFWSLLLAALLFLASCAAAASTGKKNGTDGVPSERSSASSAGSIYGYEVPEEEYPSSAAASGSGSSAKESAAPPFKKSDSSSSDGADSSGSASSGGISSAVSVPVVPPDPPDELSSAPPDTPADPVVIIESVCYEWVDADHNILYVALQLENTGAVPVEITGFELTLNTVDDRSILSYDELKNISSFTKMIEPGQYGYIVVYYSLDVKPAEGAYCTSVSAKVTHCPTVMTRKNLELDALYF